MLSDINYSPTKEEIEEEVLILVLMEYALWRLKAFHYEYYVQS